MEPVDETLGPGAVLDGTYRLERRLGVGGHGTVWLAHDESGRHGEVAIKLLSSKLAESEDVRRRFRAEAVILRTLRHPGIVRALHFSASGQRLYIVMEYLPGRSLAHEMVERAHRGEPYRIDEIVVRFTQICDAVAAAHARGVVHRDLKPQNVVVLGEGVDIVTKVLDFGIAKILGRPGEDATTLGRMLGSYLYTSPEQVSSQPIDGRADVFALGCVLFEMLTLHRAWAIDMNGRAARVGDRSLRFEGPNGFLEILRRIVAGPRPVPTDYRTELPEELDALVARALEVTPEQRFASVIDLREALSDVTTSRHPILGAGVARIGNVAPADEEPSSISDTSLIPEFTHPPTYADIPDTNLVRIDGSPAPTRLTPSSISARVRMRSGLGRMTSESDAQPFGTLSDYGHVRTAPWPWAGQAILLVLGGLLGALGYHLWLAPTPSVPAVRPTAAARPGSEKPALPQPKIAPVVDARQPEPSARGEAARLDTKRASGAGSSVGLSSRTVKPRPALSAKASRVPSRKPAPSTAVSTRASRRTRTRLKPTNRSRQATASRAAVVQLRRALKRLRSRADVDGLDALVDDIRATAGRLSDKAAAARIDRLAVASAATGDLDALEQCIELLAGTR